MDTETRMKPYGVLEAGSSGPAAELRCEHIAGGSMEAVQRDRRKRLVEGRVFPH